MKNLSILLAIFAFLAAGAVSAAPKPRHGGFSGDLGAGATATDIIRLTCGNWVGPPAITINTAKARVRDKSPVAQPAVNVQIKLAVGGSCAGAFTGAAKGDVVGQPPGVAAQANYGATSPDNNLIFSDWTPGIGISAGGQYCLKVFKTADNQNVGPGGTANGVENYEIDSHCYDSALPASHAASTGAIYTCTGCQNQ